jgi:hypothetical protein
MNGETPKQTSERTFPVHSRSRIRGGATLLIAALLLVVATVCEAPILGDADSRGGLFWIFAIAFGLSLIGFLIASLVLGIGSDAVAARIGFIAFGVLWFVAQGLYVIGTYLAPSDGLLATSTILSVLMLVGGLVAAISVGAQGLLHGAARWSLLVAVIVSGVTGGIGGATDSSGVITVLHLLSAVGLAVVGVTYLLPQAGEGRGARAR